MSKLKIPKHVAIILDGNRRYSRKLGLKPWDGHEKGIDKLKDLFSWAKELGIRELTLYCFSTENFKRSKKEVDFLFRIFKRELNDIANRESTFKDKIRANVIGRVDLFPAELQKAMKLVMQKTKKNNKLVVNFAMGYGGRQEIVDATKKIASLVKKGKIKVKNINEKLVSKNVYLLSEPEICIRPGGEVRTSNFLTWESVYSEWFFVKKMWPEFTKRDLVKIIEQYNKRSRRFGK